MCSKASGSLRRVAKTTSNGHKQVVEATTTLIALTQMSKINNPDLVRNRMIKILKTCRISILFCANASLKLVKKIKE